MAGKPVLSNYPHLHSILRNDPRANQEFNSALSSVRKVEVSGANANLEQALQTSEDNLQSALAQNASHVEAQQRVLRFVKLLGELIEEQTHLQPYTQDLSMQREYSIRFSASHIRLALRLHWDIIANAVESELSRTMVMDPALEREGDKNG